MKYPYSDLMGLPHHRSKKHSHMSRADRAAQFSPFAALTGHDAAVAETARLVDSKVELAEDKQQELDLVQQQIVAHIVDRPAVTVTYFLPDGKKAGGTYINHTGRVKKIDPITRVMVFTDGTEISLDDVSEMYMV